MNVEEYRMRLGKNILSLRKHYGISRKSLAMLIKMPVTRLRRIEMGDPLAKMYDFHVKRVARVFGISTDELLDESVNMEC